MPSFPEAAALLAAPAGVLLLLLLAARAGGELFAQRRQPRVVGEILGGLLLGPSGALAWLPTAAAVPFVPGGPATAWVARLADVGLVLLMFQSGKQLQARVSPDERRLASRLAIAGLVPPFIAGLALTHVCGDLFSAMGAAHDTLALTLVIAAAVAISSIPVISRIMLDLGLLETPFARVVLGAAIADDLVLYVVLAVAVGLATPPGPWENAVASWVGPQAAQFWLPIGHVGISLAVMAAVQAAAARAPHAARRWGGRLVLADGGAVAQAALLAAAAGLCSLLHVNPIFGALSAGLGTARGTTHRGFADSACLRWASAQLCVPLYFAGTGFRIDLIHAWSPADFLGFLAFACVAKSGCVYAGARLSGVERGVAADYAAALNARGGPGIVLAATAFAADIINRNFQVTLVLTSVATSLTAGAWLAYRLRAAGQRSAGRAAAAPCEGRRGRTSSADALPPTPPANPTDRSLSRI